MRMQEGGNPEQESLGMVSPDALAQRQRMLDTARYQPVSADLRPMAPAIDPMQAQMQPAQQAGVWAPLIWGGTIASGAFAGWPYVQNYFGGEDEPFRPALPPLTEEDMGIVDPEVLAEREGEAPAVGPYRPPPRPSEGAGEAPVVSAEEQEATPGLDISGLLGMYNFSPEERAERLRAAFEGREAVYDEILGDPERRRSVAKSQLLFSIAQRALQFASGVSPEGQPMSGSMLSQAARSFAPVAGDLATYASQMDAEDREIRAARLAAAEKDVDTAERSRAALLAALAKARGEDDSKVLTELPTASQALQEISIERPPDLTPAYTFGAAQFNAISKGLRALNMSAASETAEAVRWGTQFNTTVLADLARSIQSNRPSNMTIQLAMDMLPRPGYTFESVESAINTYAGLKDQFQREVGLLADEYNNFRMLGLAKPAIDSLSLLRRTQEVVLQLDGIIYGLEGNLPEEQAEVLGNVTEGPNPNEAQ